MSSSGDSDGRVVAFEDAGTDTDADAGKDEDEDEDEVVVV